MTTQGGGQYINYAGKKPPLGQAERRKDLVVPDQHGRNVHLVWDTTCNGCVGKYLQFRAPWIPDLKYLRVVAPNGYPVSCEWEYQQLLDDNKQAWDRWFFDLRKFGGRMNGIDGSSAYKAALEGKWSEVPKALLEECGWMPENDELIKAAMAGNKWVTGFSTIVPDWADDIVKLWEQRRARAQGAVSEDELDKYRDADGFEDEFDAPALGGRTVPVKPPAVPVGEKKPTTRRQVRLQQEAAHE